MARRKHPAGRSASRRKRSKPGWGLLTWDDLRNWAGDRSAARGRSYARQSRVKNLVLRDDGRLLATVAGGEQYVTSVWLRTRRSRKTAIESTCTCPVGSSGCKHAVAVVLAYLEVLAAKQHVPPADRNDPRWAKLERGGSADLDDFDAAPDDELSASFGDVLAEDDDPGASVASARSRAASRQDGGAAPGKNRRVPRRAASLTRTAWNEKIAGYIRAKSQAELADLVLALVHRFAELRVELQEKIALAEGDVHRLVEQARREMREVLGEIGWRNHWSDEGHTPDYTRVERKLERLVEAGHHDHVVALGAELLRKGSTQIEQSHDEGETAMAMGGCLKIVFAALAQSSRPAPDKIVFAIDARLQDEYDIIGEAADAVLNETGRAPDWSVVADRLAQRLARMSSAIDSANFGHCYQRDGLTDWLAQALERAGRGDELLALYESECRITGNYPRLVQYLAQSGRPEDAERWAREGIAKTETQWPGIANSLRRTMCEIARGRKAWEIVAAHAASAFFERPSVDTYRELCTAARKAKCGDTVSAAARQFLESGLMPRIAPRVERRKREGPDRSTWPLPVPDYLDFASDTPPGHAARSRAAPRPHLDVLLRLAIAEKQPDEVLRWYDRMHAAKGRDHRDWTGYGWNVHAAEVAAAVAQTHPERALDIHRRRLDAHLQHASISEYEACAACLRQMRPTFKALRREAEWTELVAELRQNYRNRPRFIEILDGIEGSSILQSRRLRRR